MRAATVVWRYHTTTRRADSAAIAHATAEIMSPSAGSVHSRRGAITPIATEGAIQSARMRTRRALAPENRQRARAALRTSVHVQSAAA